MKLVLVFLSLIITSSVFANSAAEKSGSLSRSETAFLEVPELNFERKTVDFCGQSKSITGWSAPICVPSIWSSVYTCTAAFSAAGVEPFSDAMCAASVAAAALSCGLSVASITGIVKHCIGL